MFEILELSEPLRTCQNSQVSLAHLIFRMTPSWDSVPGIRDTRGVRPRCESPSGDIEVFVNRSNVPTRVDSAHFALSAQFRRYMTKLPFRYKLYGWGPKFNIREQQDFASGKSCIFREYFTTGTCSPWSTHSSSVRGANRLRVRAIHQHLQWLLSLFCQQRPLGNINCRIVAYSEVEVPSGNLN